MNDEALKNSVYVWGSGIGTKHAAALPDRVHGIEGFGAIHVSLGSHHASCVTTTEHLFAWGENEHGQLGKGDFNKRQVPRRLRSLCNVRVIKVSCGRRHTLCLTDEGVFGMGANSHGQLGLGVIESKNFKEPVRITNLGNAIYDIACGLSVSAAVTLQGELMTFGSNNNGLLGNDNKHTGGSNSGDVAIPTIVAALQGRRVRSIEFGTNHAVALTAKDATTAYVFTWGDNAHGQLGRDQHEQCLVPMMVAIPAKNIKSIAAGGYHACALTTDGRLYVWGSGHHGQLGLGPSIQSTHTPLLLKPFTSSILQVACGQLHTIILCSTSSEEMNTKQNRASYDRSRQTPSESISFKQTVLNSTPDVFRTSVNGSDTTLFVNNNRKVEKKSKLRVASAEVFNNVLSEEWEISDTPTKTKKSRARSNSIARIGSKSQLSKSRQRSSSVSAADDTDDENDDRPQWLKDVLKDTSEEVKKTPKSGKKRRKPRPRSEMIHRQRTATPSTPSRLSLVTNAVVTPEQLTDKPDFNELRVSSTSPTMLSPPHRSVSPPITPKSKDDTFKPHKSLMPGDEFLPFTSPPTLAPPSPFSPPQTASNLITTSMRMRNLKSNVFAFGYNGQAQLGQGHTANRDTPQRVFAFAGLRVVEVCAGGHASAAIVTTIDEDNAGVKQIDDDEKDAKNAEIDTNRSNKSDIDVLICSWNVNDTVTSKLGDWISASKPPALMIVGLQEIVKLSASNVTKSTAFTAKLKAQAKAAGLRAKFRGSEKPKKEASTPVHTKLKHATAKWQATLQKALAQQFPGSGYVCLLQRRLVGVWTCVFARGDIAPQVKDIDSVTCSTGILNRVGNKGAIGVHLRIADTRMCFVTAHLAAGVDVDAKEKRCQDYLDVCQGLQFNPHKHNGCVTIFDHDVAFWFGDLNFRVHLSRDDVLTHANSAEGRQLLLNADELLIERRRGRVFAGWTECPIDFAPTYKYDIGTHQYDTSSKARAPAWCDRVLYRSVGKVVCQRYTRHELLDSDHRPISALFTTELRGAAPMGKILPTDSLQKTLFLDDLNPATLTLNDSPQRKNSDPSIEISMKCRQRLSETLRASKSSSHVNAISINSLPTATKSTADAIVHKPMIFDEKTTENNANNDNNENNDNNDNDSNNHNDDDDDDNNDDEIAPPLPVKAAKHSKLLPKTVKIDTDNDDDQQPPSLPPKKNSKRRPELPPKNNQ